VHYNKRWDINAANHIAHGNAEARTSSADPTPAAARCQPSRTWPTDRLLPLDATRNADGSLDVLVVGQVMTDLDAAGGQDHDNDDYERLPKRTSTSPDATSSGRPTLAAIGSMRFS
jgi:hypothetical protein